MTELLRVPLRAVGVFLTGTALLRGVGLTVGVPAGDYGTYLGAMVLSLLVAGAWAALDARRAPVARVLARWIVVSVGVGTVVGAGGAFLHPGSAPSERMGEAVAMSVFYGVPLLVVSSIGVAVGAAGRRPAVS